ncbi:MAG: hypothetical protein PVI33_05295 [Candidatus Omnitrophota bacterium]|jgi:hypothetical protein
MKKTKRDITILSFGDRIDFDEYRKFNREKSVFIKHGFDYKTVNYNNALKYKIPKINTNKLIIFLFFPFTYWNKNIEHKNYRGIYGSQVFYKKFMKFWSKIHNLVNTHFFDKEILVVNTPLLSGKCRDKRLIKLKLTEAGIHNPRMYQALTVIDIYNLLAKGHSLYLKVRYGSMGKGITYISPLNWQTNFNFKNNRIVSRKSDYGWEFRDITGNTVFLSKLIKKDILIEDAVNSLILKKKRIDLRMYMLFKRVIYIYPKTNYPQRVTTNISQGAKGNPRILKFIPKYLITKAKRIAVKTAKTLNLDLAGIDVVLDRNHKDVYVVDVNAFPGFPKRKTFNLARSIIKELIRLDNKGDLEFKQRI